MKRYVSRCIQMGVLWGVLVMPAHDGLSENRVSGPGPSLEGRYLDQGLTPQERREFHHRPQGSMFMPYRWFMALPRTDTNTGNLKSYPHFREDLAERFNFVSDPDHADGLPVGFAKTMAPARPFGEKEWLGFTCAWCHTARLRYTEQPPGGQVGKPVTHTVYIDGAPSMQNNLQFGIEAVTALSEAVRDRERFESFAREVAGHEPTDAERSDLTRRIVNFLSERALKMRAIAEGKRMQLFPVPWGFGRQDALGRGTNYVLMWVDPENIQPANAPVSFPHLWNAPVYDWVQWNGSIEHRDARNIAQTIGVGAGLFEGFFLDKGNFAPWKLRLLGLLPSRVRIWFVESRLWETSVDMDGLRWIEETVGTIAAPVWPSEFPPINLEKARRGKAAYGVWCAHCHVPAWSHAKKRFEVVMIPLEEIGTDPTSAVNFNARKIRTGTLHEVYKFLGQDMPEVMSGAEGVQYLTSKLLEPYGDRRSNYWRAPLEYMARPHVGIWATAPFLHNGSVPTLRALLDSASNRPKRFCVAGGEFDPEAVGFELHRCLPNETPLDTTIPGNSNAGHEVLLVGPKEQRGQSCQNFITDGAVRTPGVVACLTPSQRDEIIEFLKTCDLDVLDRDPRFGEPARRGQIPRIWNKDGPLTVCREASGVVTRYRVEDKGSLIPAPGEGGAPL